MAKAKSKAKTADKKKKNIKEVEIEEVNEEIEEFDDEEFDFVDEEDVEEEVETPKKKKVSKVVEDDEDDEVVELTMEERIIGIEKKQNIILVFVLITALLSLFTFISGLGGNRSYNDDETSTTNTETEQTTYDTSAFTKVKAQDLESLSKKDTIIVWIGRQGCGYCSQYVPTITSIGEKLDETIYYLDLADIFDFSGETVTILDDEAYDLLVNFATDEDNEGVMDEFGATPMTLVIKKNKIVGNYVGSYDEATALEMLEEEGFKQK